MFNLWLNHIKSTGSIISKAQSILRRTDTKYFSQIRKFVVGLNLFAFVRRRIKKHFVHLYGPILRDALCSKTSIDESKSCFS